MIIFKLRIVILENKAPKNKKNIRLKHYDYRNSGYYFITIKSYKSKNIFSYVLNNKIILKPAGIIIDKLWNEIPSHFFNVRIDEYVIMPNHLHGILILNTYLSYPPTPKLPKNLCMLLYFSFISPKNNSLSAIIRSFKSACTKQIHKERIINDRLWHHKYYDFIIRNNNDLYLTRKYILENPIKLKHLNNIKI